MLGLHILMTDGTSQGLFIVVAIVIFGIFVVLAYILFEDTLSPALASMFSDATETANERLNHSKYYHVQNAVPNDVSDFVFVNGVITEYKGSRKDVVIPYEINNQPVTGIGYRAFYNEKITSLILPNTITTIGSQAFQLNRLEKLYLPNSITDLGNASFENNLLTDLHIGSGIKVLKQEVFRDNLLEDVEIPNTVKEIRLFAFSFNYLKKFEIPKSVNKLGISIVGSKVDRGHIDTLKEIRVPKELNGLVEANSSIFRLYGYADGSIYDTPELNAITFDDSIITYY